MTQERRACARHARGTVTACSLRVRWRGGALIGGLVTADWRQGAAGELTGATGRVPGMAVGAELTRAAERHGGGGGCFGRQRSTAVRQLRWAAAMEACPFNIDAEEEGESGLKWGQQWRMGGSHREAAEAVALGWEPERRGGLRWWEPVRRARRRWRRRGAQARARAWNGAE
jgi:hypothetical protein